MTTQKNRVGKLSKKHDTPDTPDTTVAKKSNKAREDFLKVYMNNHCHVQASCAAYGIHRSTFYEWRQKYPDFINQCDNVADKLTGLVDDATIKLIIQGHPETVRDARKCLRDKSKFSRRINYDLNNLKTLDDIKATRLKAISDFGAGKIDQDTIEIINKLLDGLVSNIVASDGFKDLHEAKALFEENKIKEHG